MDALFLVALTCGCVATLKGNRTAWFLLASAAFTSLLDLRGVAFDPVIWLTIDAVVFVGILALSRRTTADWIILALFFVVGPFYFIDALAAYYVASIVASAQLFLTFPPDYARRIFARWKATFRHRHEWTNIDPKVRAR